jgi:hypothetical protein
MYINHGMCGVGGVTGLWGRSDVPENVSRPNEGECCLQQDYLGPAVLPLVVVGHSGS